METGNWKVVELTPENLGKYPLGCIKSPKHIGYKGKKPWFEQMIEKGLITLILVDENDKAQGFLEMIPGEYTWRGIEAQEYMVIHCIWIISKKVQGAGAGQYLLKEAEKRVPTSLGGIAVVTSDTSFIASSKLFEQNGYEQIDEKGVYELYLKRLDSNLYQRPAFTQERIENFEGFHMLYSLQCPMEIKWKEDIEAFCHDNEIDITMTLIDTWEQAQKNPNPLGTFALIFNNEIIEDHPISLGRFKNIVKKELKLL